MDFEPRRRPATGVALDAHSVVTTLLVDGKPEHRQGCLPIAPLERGLGPILRRFFSAN